MRAGPRRSGLRVLLSRISRRAPHRVASRTGTHCWSVLGAMVCQNETTYDCTHGGGGILLFLFFFLAALSSPSPATTPQQQGGAFNKPGNKKRKTTDGRQYWYL